MTDPAPNVVRMGDLVIGMDGKARCSWAASAPEYVAYHDEEWGRPIHDDDGLYERIMLEAFQSGLVNFRSFVERRRTFLLEATAGTPALQ